jgi:hypothetical protein
MTAPDQTTGPLLEVLLCLLTPLLMTAGVTDIGQARLAAQQAIAAYQDNHQGHLLDIAAAVGLALASLDNLRLSASASVSLPMKLRLRGNANALSHSSRSLIAAPDHPSPADEPDNNPAETAAPASPRKPEAAPPDDGRQRELLWANAMTDIAAECSRNLGKLPPAQRRAETIRIAGLSQAARHLTLGAAAAGRHPSV